MLVKLSSATVSGLDALEVFLEVNVSSKGLPGFEIIGLANRSIEESKHRIKTALINSGVSFPNRKIIVNLAPGDIYKEGTHYDLAIAVGIYCASTGKLLPPNTLFLGELSLDGSLSSVKHALLFSLFALETKTKSLIVPKVCQTSFVYARSKIKVYGVSSLSQVLQYLNQETTLEEVNFSSDSISLKSFEASENLYDTIVGHSSGKRALEISCAGGHNLCLYGPPGSGKSLLAKSMQELLPPLSESEVLEVNKIYSAVGKLTSTNPLVKQRPYRDPHHTISYSGMVGGGSTPVPGEITLAHRGVLFMDEFAEFQRPVLEALRQPMEDGKITLVRSKGTFTYPAKFTLVAATNLCPCGNLGNPVVLCKCSPSEVARYKRKISGALLDRFDLFVYVLPVGKNELVSKPVAKFASNLQDVRRRILLAHEKQSLRLAPFGLIKNNEMQLSHINKLINLQDKDKEFLNFAAEKLNLSTRGYLKILKVARTIADLNNHEEINKDDLSESLQFRNKQLI